MESLWDTQKDESFTPPIGTYSLLLHLGMALAFTLALSAIDVYLPWRCVQKSRTQQDAVQAVSVTVPSGQNIEMIL